MTSETTTNKLNSNNMYECEHCNKQFTRERTLMVHVCEQKRRYMQRDEKGVQVGYLAYNRFFQLAQGATKGKTYEHFAKSPYYIAFCKFGRHVISRTILEADTFIDWLITQNVGIDEWAKELWGLSPIPSRTGLSVFLRERKGSVKMDSYNRFRPFTALVLNPSPLVFLTRSSWLMCSS